MTECLAEQYQSNRHLMHHHYTRLTSVPCIHTIGFQQQALQIQQSGHTGYTTMVDVAVDFNA